MENQTTVTTQKQEVADENTPAPLAIEFITKPDALGMGRVVLNGRYYGLPMAIVLDYQRLHAERAARAFSNTYYENLALIAESLEGFPGHQVK